MSEPFGDPRGVCFLCDEPATEDVDAIDTDEGLIHDECLAMEEDPYRMTFSAGFILELGERYTARINASKLAAEQSELDRSA